MEVTRQWIFLIAHGLLFVNHEEMLKSWRQIQILQTMKLRQKPLVLKKSVPMLTTSILIHLKQGLMASLLTPHYLSTISVVKLNVPHLTHILIQ